MCAASGVNGLPSCARGDYNNGILRDEYGWDGFFVTGKRPLDCEILRRCKVSNADGNGVGYLWQSYGLAPGPGCVSDGATTPVQACQLGVEVSFKFVIESCHFLMSLFVLQGGVDVELGDTYNVYLPAAVQVNNGLMIV
jgi:hypothetical protein